MSLDGRYIDVHQDASGRLLSFTGHGERNPTSVTGVVEHFREWIGALEGEPERDVWRVETHKGTCELHHLRYPHTEDDEPTGFWLIFRWDD